MRFTTDLDWFRIFEAVGVWSAAFATLVAAYVALKIARRQDEIRLRVSAAAGQLVEADSVQDIVWIRIINVARRTATVSSIGWKLSRFSRYQLYQIIEAPNPSPPFEVKDGQLISISWPISRGVDDNWYDLFGERMSEFNFFRRFFELRAMRLQVMCTTGEEFLSRPSKQFLDHVREAIERHEKGASKA